MKHLKNENYQIQVHSAPLHKEYIVAEVTKAIERKRVITTKKVASITTLSDAQKRNLVMSNKNQNNLLIKKENTKLNLTM